MFFLYYFFLGKYSITAIFDFSHPFFLVEFYPEIRFAHCDELKWAVGTLGRTPPGECWTGRSPLGEIFNSLHSEDWFVVK